MSVTAVLRPAASSTTTEKGLTIHSPTNYAIAETVALSNRPKRATTAPRGFFFFLC